MCPGLVAGSFAKAAYSKAKLSIEPLLGVGVSRAVKVVSYPLLPHVALNVHHVRVDDPLQKLLILLLPSLRFLLAPLDNLVGVYGH